MPTRLDPWKSASVETFAAATSDADRSMMLRLLQTSCLLELSKLSDQVDLGTYAQTVVDVISQFFPTDGVELLLELPGLPEMHATFGSTPTPDTDAVHAELLEGASVARHGAAHASAIRWSGEPVGMLTMWEPTGSIGAEAFIAAASAQLAETLRAIAESERLRRRAAGEMALRLAASIDERSGEEQFDDLVEAVAALPRTTGANLYVSSCAFDPPIECTAGLLMGPVKLASENEFEPGGRVRLTLTWSQDPEPTDRAQIDELLAVLVGSLERAERHARLLQEAETDELTQLANRRRASRALASALNRAERHGESVAIAAVDLDGFKSVNDALGHDVGDLVLRTVARVLSEEARSYDLPARLGGDEFVAILPMTDAVGARAFGGRILSRVERESSALLPEGVGVTASIGIAIYPQHASGPDALMRAADEALYAAKAAGRNCVRFVDGPA